MNKAAFVDFSLHRNSPAFLLPYNHAVPFLIEREL